MANETTVTAPAVSRLSSTNTPVTASSGSLFFPSRIGAEAKFPYMKIQCLSSSSVSNNFNSDSIVSGLYGAATKTGDYTSKLMDSFKDNAQTTPGKVLGEIAGNAVVGLANLFGKISFSPTGAAIGLYIPELQESIDPVWGEKDMMIAGNLQEISSAATAGNQTATSDTAGGLAAILAGKSAAKFVEGLASKIGINDSVADMAAFATRRVPNQKRTLLFDGMNLRSFAFSWKLVPRNRNELETIYKIIDTLKLQALPSLAVGGTLFAFPDPVRISFHNVDTSKFPTINECVIDAVKVNYTPDRALQLFESGAPVSISVDLSVKELDVLVRNGNSISSSGMYQ